MSKDNRSRFALLGMLSIQPMSGYDMKKRIEESVSNFWSESYGQIYPMLKQLSEEGLTISHAEKQEGKPERYVYALTEQGREELCRWLAEPVEHSIGRNELLLKLYFGQQIPIASSITHVQSYRALQQQLLQKYTQIEQYLKSDKTARSVFSLITLSYGQHTCRAMLAWCDETLATLKKLES